MKKPTFFPNGVSTVSQRGAFAGIPVLDGSYDLAFIDADDSYNLLDIISGAPVHNVVTIVGTGAATLVGGKLTLTNSAADNDSIQVQRTPAAVDMTALSDPVKIAFSAKLEVSDATQSDILVGVASVDTTALGGAGTEQEGVSDGVFFVKADGTTNILAYVRAGGSTIFTSDVLGTLEDGVPVDLGFVYDGVDSLAFYVNGSGADIFEATTPVSEIPQGAMTSTVALRNGEAAAKSLTLYGRTLAITK